jgi:hypothetical protein
MIKGSTRVDRLPALQAGFWLDANGSGVGLQVKKGKLSVLSVLWECYFGPVASGWGNTEQSRK